MKYLFLILFFAHIFNAQAQGNLVLNPSFENVTSCPSNYSEYNKCLHWRVVNAYIPDLLSTCATNANVSVPTSNLGLHFQYPNSGNNYVDILVFRKSIDPNHREYIQGEFSDTLERKKVYKVEFYINLTNLSIYSVSNIGAYLSNDTFFYNNTNSLPYLPQILNDSTTLLSDTLNWTKISKKYVAIGGEKYITIGCFSQQTGLDTIKVYPIQCLYCDAAVYNIDDVSVSLWDSTNAVNEIHDLPQINVSPNPSQSNFTVNISFQNKDTEFELYDVFGTLQQKKKLLNNITNFNTDLLPNGLYLYRVISSNKIIRKGKLVIAK